MFKYSLVTADDPYGCTNTLTGIDGSSYAINLTPLAVDSTGAYICYGSSLAFTPFHTAFKFQIPVCTNAIPTGKCSPYGPTTIASNSILPSRNLGTFQSITYGDLPRLTSNPLDRPFLRITYVRGDVCNQASGPGLRYTTYVDVKCGTVNRQQLAFWGCRYYIILFTTDPSICAFINSRGSGILI